jgi:hypothetical protein
MNKFASVRPARNSVGPVMQLQELADTATLLAAWPQPLVEGVTNYMNLFTPVRLMNACSCTFTCFESKNYGLLSFP